MPRVLLGYNYIAPDIVQKNNGWAVLETWRDHWLNGDTTTVIETWQWTTDEVTDDLENVARESVDGERLHNENAAAIDLVNSRYYYWKENWGFWNPRSWESEKFEKVLIDETISVSSGQTACRAFSITIEKPSVLTFALEYPEGQYDLVVTAPDLSEISPENEYVLDHRKEYGSEFYKIESDETGTWDICARAYTFNPQAVECRLFAKAEINLDDIVDVSDPVIVLPRNGGTETFSVASEYPFEIETDSDWLTVTATRSSQNASYSVSCAENDSAVTRTAIVEITIPDIGTRSVEVEQEGAGLFVSPVEIRFDDKPFGFASSATLTVSNEVAQDVGVLEVYGFSDTSFSVEGVSVGDTVPAMGAFSFSVVFSPADFGFHEGVFRMSTELGEVAVPVSGNAVSGGQNAPFEEKVRLSADYILSCQYLAENDPCGGNIAADGAINDIYSAPDENGCRSFDWIVPRENALACLGLQTAYEITGDERYTEAAEKALDFLVRIQDGNDGGWYNQYDFDRPGGEPGKSPTQTAETMMAFHKFGFEPSRYEAMIKGAEFLMQCAKVENKTGNDDGLLGGGKDAHGDFSPVRWTSDNCFAYQALRAAEDWAMEQGDSEFADACNLAAARILKGIENHLYDPSSGVWFAAVDATGDPVGEFSTWINYAPAMLDVPVQHAADASVGDWIHSNLQGTDGAVRWNDGIHYGRRSPGFGFQAALAWFDMDQASYVRQMLDWAYQSDLWTTAPDENQIAGGWIDWKTASNSAPWWERFIDTEFYWISVLNGGCDFSSNSIKGVRIPELRINAENLLPGIAKTLPLEISNFNPYKLVARLDSLNEWIEIDDEYAEEFVLPANGTVKIPVVVSLATPGSHLGALRLHSGESSTLILQRPKYWMKT